MQLGKLPQKKVLIGIGPIRLILQDGRSVIFAPSAKMYGLPNGSVAITGPRHIVGNPKKVTKKVPTVKSVIYNRPPEMPRPRRAKSSPHKTKGKN
jgi:hypothetical protein